MDGPYPTRIARTTTKTELPDPPINPDAGAGSTQASLLLCLPPFLRRRIYHDVGLASWDAHRPFGFDLHTGRATFGTPAAASFYGLLLSCRAIYSEAAALLYSANRFSIRYTHPGSLGPLRSLTAPSLASLTHLKIVLHQAPCYHPSDIFNDGGYRCLHGRPHYAYSGLRYGKRAHDESHPAPLLSDDGDGLARLRVQGMLNEWHSTAAYLSLHIVSQLELSLVCDLDPKNGHALDVAESVTAPLRQHFPSLRSCHVRLAKTADFRLYELAREAVMVMQARIPPYLNPSSTPTATSLMDLPRELRIHILKYTDLILPFRTVTWSRRNSGYLAKATRAHSRLPGWPFITRFHTCSHGKRSGTPGSCFCHCYHAAFSTCRCWVPPSPLFLVCRELYQDALFVFFTGNHFIVHDFQTDPQWWVPDLFERLYVHDVQLPEPSPRYDHPNERFAASQFLRDVVPVGALAHLRSLELLFPSYLALSWPQSGQPAMQDWWATVDWLRDKINAPGLTLWLVGAEARYDWADAEDNPTITPAQGDAIMQSYIDIVRPLRKLLEGPDGLAWVQVDFRYPWQYVETTERRRWGGNYYKWLCQRDRETNDKLVRYVVGDRSL